MNIQIAKNVIEFAKTELTDEFNKAIKIADDNLEAGEFGYCQEDYDEIITSIERIQTLEIDEDTNPSLVGRIEELEFYLERGDHGIFSNRSSLALELMKIGDKLEAAFYSAIQSTKIIGIYPVSFAELSIDGIDVEVVNSSSHPWVWKITFLKTGRIDLLNDKWGLAYVEKN